MKDDSVATSFRRRRFHLFLDMLPAKRPLSILDIGGTPSYWKALGLYRDPSFSITIANVGTEPYVDENLHIVNGNACDLAEYPDGAFDVVHSNSVIEHVGRWPEMQAMAREVRRLAPSYFVQTPDYGFPIEPHYKLPIVHWLPEAPRIKVLRIFHKVPDDMEKCLASVRHINLITKSQMRALFPDGVVKSERFLGMSKSILAIRQGEQSLSGAA